MHNFLVGIFFFFFEEELVPCNYLSEWKRLWSFSAKSESAIKFEDELDKQAKVFALILHSVYVELFLGVLSLSLSLLFLHSGSFILSLLQLSLKTQLPINISGAFISRKGFPFEIEEQGEKSCAPARYRAFSDINFDNSYSNKTGF